MPVSIPLDVRAITILVSETKLVERPIRQGPNTVMRKERVTTLREVPPRQDRRSFDQALEYANRVFQPADIQFVVQSFQPGKEEIPNGAERVDSNGFLYLARKFPARRCLSVLLVADFERHELGGEAVEEQAVCIVCALGNPGTGKVLAHELGHLLDLEHVPRDSPRANWNLMYQALRAGDELTADQVAHARASRIGKQFAGSTAK